MPQRDRPLRDQPISYEDHMRGAVVERATIDLFLDPERPSWAAFDPVTGYRLANFIPHDGIGGCGTISTYGPDLARTGQLYADKTPRIAVYGDSFTQCQQVSDGETWEEQLAAHFGEPIRNLGVGGFGVYHAYRRMVAEEQTERGCEYVVLYVWGDDHLRSLQRCRHAAIYPTFDTSGTAFHANFWANLEMDLDRGRIVERENLLPTPESLYRMTDPEWMVEAMRDDHATRMWLYVQGWVADLDMPPLRALAEALDVPADGLGVARPEPATVQALLDRYSLAATEMLLTQAQAFADEHGKQLLVVLFDPFRVLEQLVAGEPRWDQPIVDFLHKRGLRHFDMNPVHVEDFGCFKLSFDEYMKRYFVGRVGHYSPAGNHFFAHALKPTLVEWLDPKPITYAPSDEPWLEFGGYLRGAGS